MGYDAPKDQDLKDSYLKSMQSKGAQKMVLYFQNLTKDEVFRGKILEIRKLIGDTSESSAKGAELRTQFWLMIDSLCEEYKLPLEPWRKVIGHIVREDEWDFDYIDYGFDVCEIITDDEDKMYPIKVGVSPYASREDVISYIKTNYMEVIAPLLEVHKDQDIKIGKFRRRRKEEIYDFIFNNQHLSGKEIMRLVSEEFGTVYGYDQIRKILQREKERRNSA